MATPRRPGRTTLALPLVLGVFFLLHVCFHKSSGPDTRATGTQAHSSGQLDLGAVHNVRVRTCPGTNGTVITIFLTDPPADHRWLDCKSAAQVRPTTGRRLLAGDICRDEVMGCKRQRTTHSAPVGGTASQPAGPALATPSATGDGDASQLMDVDTEETAAATISYGTASEAYMAEPGYIETLTLTLTLTAPATRTLTLSL